LSNTNHTKTNNDLHNITQNTMLCRSLFVFSGVCVAQCLVFCRSLFVFSVVCVAKCLVFTNNDLHNITQNTKYSATQTSLKTNNDLHNTTQNTKNWATQTTLKQTMISLFVFSVVCVAQCLVFCVMLCRSLFVFSVVCVAQCLVLCVVFYRSLFVTLSNTNPTENKQWSTQHYTEH
jgi:hypothetical protein